MLIRVLTALIASVAAAVADDSSGRPAIVLVIGAAGSSEYGEQFTRWAERWQKAADQSSTALTVVGEWREPSAASPQVAESQPSPPSDKDQLRLRLESISKDSPQALWIILLGHGTFDGREAKFNLRGPDVSAQELAAWLQPFRRPLAIINCASSSGPFMSKLASPSRVVVTATRSGHEHNYARFGDYFSAAIIDPAADLDKDGQTSLLEAYLAASHRVDEFYKQEARLATEHALLDDNGDGLGTPAAWFEGLRATRRAKDGAALDGSRAHQMHLLLSAREQAMPADLRARRDELELALEALRDKKSSLEEGQYFDQLEALLVELAELYEKADQKAEKTSGKSAAQ